MSREIRFRARFRKISTSEEIWQFARLDRAGICNPYDSLPGGYVQVSDWEQSSGLKDSKGVEIYDGDVMTHPDFKKDANPVVSFDGGCFCLSGWDCIMTDFSKGVVNGNINENQELIDGKE